MICIDDGSTADFIERNRPIADIGQYIVLGKNVGRARVRNLFLNYAKGDYLLFLDDDGIVNDGFINNYVNALTHPTNAIKQSHNNAIAIDVIVGGRVYDTRFNDRQHRLRYVYGQRSECRNAAERAREPYNSFMTNNFLIRRELFDSIRFDERLAGYGHEDTLFGHRLRQKGACILHIDNPVTNDDVETNAEFLCKSVEAVESLAQIYGFMQGDRDFCRSVRLLRTYESLRRLGLCRPVLSLFRYTQGCLKHRLETASPASLAMFNFYKLGTFLSIVRQTQKTSSRQK